MELNGASLLCHVWCCCFFTSWRMSVHLLSSTSNKTMNPPTPTPSSESIWHVCISDFLFLRTHTMVHSGFLFMKKKKSRTSMETPAQTGWHISQGVNRWFPKGADTWPHLGFTARSGHLCCFSILTPCRGLCYYRCPHLTFIYFRFHRCFRYTQQ